jgi:hypothetical protein
MCEERNMSPLLPRSLRDHLSFAEAFDILGRALLPEEWSGAEISPPGWNSVLPPDEAAMQDEADQLRSVLRKRGYRYDDDHIRRIFETNEHTGDWDQAWQARDRNDPDNWAQAVVRLSYLIEALSENPLSRTQAVADLAAVHDRRQKTLTALLTLLADDKLEAFCEQGHVRERIRPERWADKTLQVDIANGAADCCCPSGTVVLHRKNFATIIQQIAPSGDGLTKLGAANVAEVELRRMMSDEPRRKREDVFADFRQRWPQLSERDFNHRWKVACEMTKSGWNKPGRIPDSHTDVPPSQK